MCPMERQTKQGKKKKDWNVLYFCNQKGRYTKNTVGISSSRVKSTALLLIIAMDYIITSEKKQRKVKVKVTEM